jgi:hypothetical protein
MLSIQISIFDTTRPIPQAKFVLNLPRSTSATSGWPPFQQLPPKRLQAANTSCIRQVYLVQPLPLGVLQERSAVFFTDFVFGQLLSTCSVESGAVVMRIAFI